MKKRRNRLNLSNDEKSNIGCIAIIVAVVLFIIIYMIIKGFSFYNALTAFSMVSGTVAAICGLVLGLAAIPVIIVYYFRFFADKPKAKGDWTVPFLEATFFVVLYGLFRFIFSDTVVLLVGSFDFVEDAENTSRWVLFILFELSVFLGCLYIRKHPDNS